MADLTFWIMFNPPNHALSGIQNAARYQIGDIVDVYPATKHAIKQPNGDYIMQSQRSNPRLRWVHVTNVPKTADIIRDVIMQEIIGLPTISDTEEVVIRKRRYMLNLPQSAIDIISIDKEITIDITAFLSYFCQKIIASNMDSSQDVKSIVGAI